MKKWLLSLFFVALISFIAKAATSYKTTNDPGVAFNRAVVVDLNDPVVSRVSAQAVYSTVTWATSSFDDGAPSTASIIVSSYTALSSATAVNTVIIASNTALSGTLASNTISIASNPYLNSYPPATYISFNGTTFTLNRDWYAYAFSTQTATSLANAINSAALYGVTASTTGTGSTVTLTSTIYGTAYNNLTLVSSTQAALTVANPTLVGGKDLAVLNFNGYKFTANRDFVVNSFSTNTALSIATMLNRSSYSVTAATATVGSTAAVTLTAINYGPDANSYYLTTSTAAFLIFNSSFTGGRNAVMLKVNGVPVLAQTHYSVGASSAATAKAISDAMMANPNISSIVISTWASNVIYATTTLSGVSYSLYTSSQTALRISTQGSAYSDNSATGTFTGGYSSDISTITNIISTGNVYVPGLPVLYSKSAGAHPGILSQNTTYFVTNPSPTGFQLAYTATGAIAGSALSIASQTAAGGGVFSVAPLAMTGSGGLRWQVSNDSVTWSDLVSVATLTINAASLQNSSTYWDLGTVNARFLRLNVSSTTTGGYSLKTYINGKD